MVITMLRYICLLLLVSIAPYSIAGWVEYGGGAGGTLYIDPTTLRIENGLARIWVMFDNKQAKIWDKTTKLRSNVSFVEVDCAEVQMRYLVAKLYSQHKAKGEPFEVTSEPQPWGHIAPNSIGSAIGHAACKDQWPHSSPPIR